MHVLVITQQSAEDLPVIHVQDVEAAIEKLYASTFDIVIIGNDVRKAAENKFRKILSMQNYEILVVNQQAEPLKFTLAQSKFMLNNYRHAKGGFSFNDAHDEIS